MINGIVSDFENKKIISPPYFLTSNLQFEVIGGSKARGVETKTSDTDVYGFTMPPKDWVFPHLSGSIKGFDNEHPFFESWQEAHHNNHDFAIFSFTRFMYLLYQSSANFPYLLYSKYIKKTNMVKPLIDNREEFITKKLIDSHLNWAKSQFADIKKKSYDTKKMYHCVRLVLEAEGFIIDKDPRFDKNSSTLQQIRDGDITKEHASKLFLNRYNHVEYSLENSSLSQEVDYIMTKKILTDGLEEYYGKI